MGQSEARAAAFLHTAADVRLQLNHLGQVQFVDGRTDSVFGQKPHSLMGRDLGDFFFNGDQQILETMVNLLPRNQRLNPIVLRINHPDGRLQHVLVNAYRPPENPLIAYVTLTIAHMGLASNDFAIDRDPDTGLKELGHFIQTAQHCLDHLHLYDDAYFLTLIELDGMEEIVEKCQPEYLQQVFQQFGNMLRALSVSGDMAGRLSDYKFAIIHTDAVSPELIYTNLQTVLHDLKKIILGVRIQQSVIDLSEFRGLGKDGGRAVTYALTAFRQQNDNKIQLDNDGEELESEGDLSDIMVETTRKIASISRTISKNKFEVVFQPIVDISSRRLSHFESLTRFEKDKSPYDMIIFAEQTGMIADFDMGMVRRALDILRNPLTRDISVAVNLSAQSLQNSTFVNDLMQLLARNKDLRHRIFFEITESSLITDFAKINNAVLNLQQHGHKICLDDFGAGATSFQYLQAIPADYVKIDGMYTKRMVDGHKDRAILKAMVGACHELGMATVGEMIEDEDQRDLLSDLGVSYGQGYLFGRPLDLEEAVQRELSLLPLGYDSRERVSLIDPVGILDQDAAKNNVIRGKFSAPQSAQDSRDS